MHCYPDFQDYKVRLASFPNYWQPDHTSTAQALAKEGLFFSHPRLTGFQVSCFSCGNVDPAPVDQPCAGASDQQTTSFVHLDSCNKSASALPLPSAPLLALRFAFSLLSPLMLNGFLLPAFRDLPYAVAQLVTLVSAIAVFLSHCENNAQVIQAFLYFHISMVIPRFSTQWGSFSVEST